MMDLVNITDIVWAFYMREHELKTSYHTNRGRLNEKWHTKLEYLIEAKWHSSEALKDFGYCAVGLSFCWMQTINIFHLCTEPWTHIFQAWFNNDITVPMIMTMGCVGETLCVSALMCTLVKQQWICGTHVKCTPSCPCRSHSHRGNCWSENSFLCTYLREKKFNKSRNTVSW